MTLDTDRDALLDMLATIELVRGYGPADEQTLRKDVVCQAATLRWMHGIGEAGYRLSSEFKKAHPRIAPQGIVGMRHLVRDYDSVRFDAVWKAVNSDVPKLERQIRATLAELE